VLVAVERNRDQRPHAANGGRLHNLGGRGMGKV
jgi:hypothetical protein